jgi:hypothetical protein
MNQYERLLRTREAIAYIIRSSKLQALRATGAWPEDADLTALSTPSFSEIEDHVNTVINADISFEDVMAYADALKEAGK